MKLLQGVARQRFHTTEVTRGNCQHPPGTSVVHFLSRRSVYFADVPGDVIPAELSLGVCNYQESMFGLTRALAASVRGSLDRSPLTSDSQTHVHTFTGSVTPRNEWCPASERRRNTTN